jgi:Kdo2-lipid IVA lauroyltransferase/acyltransferase
MKERIEAFAFSSTAALLQLLPLRMVRILAKCISTFVYYIIPFRKSLTLQQLREAFPDEAEKQIKRWARLSYQNFITTLFELMWTPRFSDEVMNRVLHIPEAEVLLGAHGRDKGLILMSGHFGNWEWLSCGVAAMLGLPFKVVVHPMNNPRVDSIVERYRTSKGNTVVPMGISIRDVLKTLQSKGVVAMLADQSAPKESLFVEFMGKPTATFEGPALFALRTGAPIVFGFSVRKADGNYDVLLEEIPTDDLDGATSENILELTRRHVQVLESMIRKYPYMWLWQHRRWKHQPPNENASDERNSEA